MNDEREAQGPASRTRIRNGISAHGVRLAAYVLLAVVVRVALYRDFPVFLTLDSPDYVLAADDIAKSFDFRGDALGDWRLPGYPVFLALVRPLTGSDLQHVVWVQGLLGMGSVWLGLVIGRLLGSRVLAEVLVLFLGLSPVALLNEHLLMTEALFSFTILGFGALVIVCLRGRWNAAAGLALGAVFSICLLIRSNGLFFCLPMLAGMLFVRRADARADLGKLALGFVFATALIGGPWVWRNYSLLGSVTPFTQNFNRNLLIYQSQHGLLDRSLPFMGQWGGSYDPEHPGTIYRMIMDLGRDTDEAERRAGAIRREQMADHPGRYLAEVLRSAANLGGYLGPYPGRNDVEVWFDRVVGNVHILNSTNAALMDDLTSRGFEITRASRNTALTRAWSRLGRGYLGSVRPLLFSAFIVCFLVILGRPRRDGGERDVVAGLVGTAYLVTIGLHSVTLSDYDRFATPFDWVPILVIGLVAPRLRSLRTRSE